jgi:antirestriction protein ArdC
MSRSAARARTGQDRTSLYQEITEKIIAELEAGRIPWVQPWGTAAAKAPLAMPQNAASSRRYSGINVLILWGAVIERGFAGQSWLTFRQALLRSQDNGRPQPSSKDRAAAGRGRWHPRARKRSPRRAP